MRKKHITIHRFEKSFKYLSKNKAKIFKGIRILSPPTGTSAQEPDYLFRMCFTSQASRSSFPRANSRWNAS